MKNKIVIITGANSGIGKQATIKFAKSGYTVVMACRNIEKSIKVKEEIIGLSNNPNIDLLQLDVSSMESIKKFTDNFLHKYEKLDILINNAGHFKHGEKIYQLSKDNIELTFATNLIGPFLLVELLKDAFMESSDPRVLNACTTNIRHFFEPKRKIDFNNLQGENKKKYNSYKMYGDSKMAFLMLTFKLAEVYPNIKINAVQIPAIKISKETRKNLKLKWRILASIQNLFSNSQESMAETYFYITTSDDFNNVSGKMINADRLVMRVSDYKDDFKGSVKQLFDQMVYPKYADNQDNIDKVWNLCNALTKKMNI